MPQSLKDPAAFNFFASTKSERHALFKKSDKSGQGRDRTGDTRIFSPVLYQLSYLAVAADEALERAGKRSQTSEAVEG